MPCQDCNHWAEQAEDLQWRLDGAEGDRDVYKQQLTNIREELAGAVDEIADLKAVIDAVKRELGAA